MQKIGYFIFVCLSSFLWAGQEMVTDANDNKWLIPSKEVCEKNGGMWKKMVNREFRVYNGEVTVVEDAYGCEANWGSAIKICEAMGGKLPTIEELRGVVTFCGGKPHDYIKNKSNSDYRACYMKVGFLEYESYWSSSIHPKDNEWVWYIYFYYGVENPMTKDTEVAILCIKK